MRNIIWRKLYRSHSVGFPPAARCNIPNLSQLDNRICQAVSTVLCGYLNFFFFFLATQTPGKLPVDSCPTHLILYYTLHYTPNSIFPLFPHSINYHYGRERMLGPQTSAFMGVKLYECTLVGTHSSIRTSIGFSHSSASEGRE